MCCVVINIIMLIVGMGVHWIVQLFKNSEVHIYACGVQLNSMQGNYN